MSAKREAPSEKWMGMAASLALNGAGRTHPNPAVGAVVVRNGKVVGMGWHEGPGTPHAEVVALREAGRKAEGADLYVTLEPCPTYGRTPPCTDAIISAGVGRVIAGTSDPNPAVNGGGLSVLKRNGVQVVSDFLECEAVAVDASYHRFYKKNRPSVTLKWAQSIDGATADAGGRYITGAEARRLVHEDRFFSDAIVVTSGTVLRDEPKLTVRLPGVKRKKLVRVVVDRHGLKDLPAGLKKTAPAFGEIWVLRTSRFGGAKPAGEGVKVFDLDVKGDLEGFVPEMLIFLRKKRLISLYVEAVGEFATALLNSGFVDKLAIHVAPFVLGKGSAPVPVPGPLAKRVSLIRAREMSPGKDRVYEVDLEGKCLRD